MPSAKNVIFEKLSPIYGSDASRVCWRKGVARYAVPLTLAVVNLLWKPATAAITQTWLSFDV